MTISKKQLRESYETGVTFGIRIGKEQQSKEMQSIRQGCVLEISKAAAELAMANAKLTYALSRITDKIL